MKVKIAIIGAGSAVWSSQIVVDILLTPSLRGSEISLMDIDEERLRLIHDFARRYARELGSEVSFTKTTDRREAIEGADFVINTAMARGHSFYEALRAATERHGYYRGLNSVEWNMVSDYHTIWGYYQFKLALEIARDVEELAPDAYLLLIANPVFELTTMISRLTRVKTIGLCHGFAHVNDLISTLALEPEDVKAEAIGFNHVIWLTRFRYKGEDAYHLIDEWIERESEEYWRKWRESQWNPFDIQMSPAAVDMYKIYGLFPIGDTVRGGTWKYHYDLETKRRWYGPSGGPDSEVGWEVYLMWLESRLREIGSALADPATPLASVVPARMSGEAVIPLIDSIISDRPAIYQVNVLNKGSIPGLPDDVAVEMPALVDARGVRRLEFSELPRRIMRVMRQRLWRAEWAIDAFLEGGRDYLLEWALVDQRTKSASQAERAVDALLSVPGNEEMARHFK